MADQLYKIHPGIQRQANISDPASCPGLSYDKFQELIKIANPDIERELHKYDFYLQILISQFTRIFNIEQILYILDEYAPHTGEAKRLACMLGKVAAHLKGKLIKEYGPEYLDGIDIYELLASEIENNFAETDSKSVIYQVHKICLYACQIERQFQLRDFEFRMAKIKNNKMPGILKKRKYSEMQSILGKREKIWDGFLRQYSGMPPKQQGRPDDRGHAMADNNGVGRIASFIKEKGIEEVTMSSEGVKNTFSFYRYMAKHKDLQASKNFMALFLPYAKSEDLKHENLMAVSRHIHSFRLANIFKMLFIISTYDMNCEYGGSDISRILSGPINAAIGDSCDLSNMDADILFEMLNRDASALAGVSDVISHPEAVPFLFCSYLDIENAWHSFDSMKFNAIADGFKDKAVAKLLSTEAHAIDMFFQQYSRNSGYQKTINELEGKIIPFRG